METAIEWFVDELQRAEFIPKDSSLMNWVILEAKKIEEKQIINAFNEGNESDWSNEFGDGGEQYYNETFKPE
jgi:hypothetical protein